MSGPPSLWQFGLSGTEMLGDVYFRRDFLELYARPDPVDTLVAEGFCQGAAVRTIPATEWTDLETPHGYGGPAASDRTALAEGLAAWRKRQGGAGRVAEFIRLHPCLEVAALDGLVDCLSFNRNTVMVPLDHGREARWQGYSKTTRNILRQTARQIVVRRLGASEAPLFQQLYEAMLARHGAGPRFWFRDQDYRDLLAAPWCIAWVAETAAGEALAASCFLAAAAPIAHYHLSGGTEAGLRAQAQYPLLEAAFEHFAAEGRRWLHLGGGRTAAPDDGLYLFKAKFSPIHARFHIAGLIHDRSRYQALGGARDGRFLGYREG